MNWKKQMKTYQTEKKQNLNQNQNFAIHSKWIRSANATCECRDKHNCQLATCNCPDWLCHKLWQALPNVNFSLIHSLTQSTTLLLLSAEMRADDTVLLLLFFSFLSLCASHRLQILYGQRWRATLALALLSTSTLALSLALTSSLQLVNNAGSDCDCECGLCARSLVRSAGAWVSYKIIYILFCCLALLTLTPTAQLASAVAWRVASGLIRSSRLDFHMYMLWIECFMGLVW